MHRLGWVSGALLYAGAALAQETPAEPTDPADPSEQPIEGEEPVEGAVEEEEPGPPDTFQGDWEWTAFGPKTLAGMSDVAQHPSRTETIAAVTTDGQVWLTTDRGASWSVVLDGGRNSLGTESNDEDILIGIEARVEEILDELETDDLSVDPDDYVDDLDGLEAAIEEMEARAEEIAQEASDAAEDALEQAWGEFYADGVTDSQAASTAISGRNRVWFDDEERLLVGRVDGLHLSRDLGGTWSRVLDVGVNALVRLPHRNLWVAGTADGVRFAVDLSIWIDSDDGTEGLYINDLAADGDGIYAGTASGLWFAPDAQTWGQIGNLDDPVTALLVDPTSDGGLWLSDGLMVLRSNDAGATATAGFGASLAGVSEMVWLGAGHLLAASANGPWESMDGGSSWWPVSEGLADPGTGALALHGGDVLLASKEGISRLEEAREEPADLTAPPDLSSFEPAVVPDWIPADVLIGTMMSRQELTARGGSRLAAAALPELTIAWQHQAEDGLDFVAGGGSSRELGAQWKAGIQLKWKGGGRLVVDGTGGPDVGLAPSSAGSALKRGASAYGLDLASEVAEMCFARAELVALRPPAGATSLREEVDYELEILELEAQLDHITNGAVSAWRSQ